MTFPPFTWILCIATGIVSFLLVIYAVSVGGGSLFSLWLHRHHDYEALGASGGVCGVIFAAIFRGGT